MYDILFLSNTNYLFYLQIFRITLSITFLNIFKKGGMHTINFYLSSKY